MTDRESELHAEINREANRKLHDEYPCGITEKELRDYLEGEVSHWPNKQGESLRKNE